MPGLGGQKTWSRRQSSAPAECGSGQRGCRVGRQAGGQAGRQAGRCRCLQLVMAAEICCLAVQSAAGTASPLQPVAAATGAHLDAAVEPGAAHRLQPRAPLMEAAIPGRSSKQQNAARLEGRQGRGGPAAGAAAGRPAAGWRAISSGWRRLAAVGAAQLTRHSVGI